MKRRILTILTIILTTVSYGQKKIIFRKGLHREVIKVERTIGVTKKGETFKFDEWKSICSGCKDCLWKDNIWKLDSIHNDYIVVRQLIDNDSAFKFDTISYTDKKKLKNYSKEWFWVTEIQSPDSNTMHNKLVYKYPIAFNRQRILIDSITSFSFSKQENCSGFGIGFPLMGLIMVVASPVAAFDNGKFDAGLFIIGETLGLGIFYLIYRSVNNTKIKTYRTDEWNIRVK